MWSWPGRAAVVRGRERASVPSYDRLRRRLLAAGSAGSDKGRMNAPLPPQAPAPAPAATAFSPAWSAMLRRTLSSWIDDDAPTQGAALAYYTLFSIAPTLLIAIAVAGLAFGEEAARGEILGQLRGLMGEEGAATVQALLASLRLPETGGLAMLTGLGTLFIGATTVFAQLQGALDRIWQAPQPPAAGLLAWVRARVLSFGMVMAIGFLLMVSLVTSAALAAWTNWWNTRLPAWSLLLQGVNALAGFGLATLGFAMIYKIMPRVRIAWRDVWVGAAVTALLFSAGRPLIGLYIGRSGVSSGFGAAGVGGYANTEIGRARWWWCWSGSTGRRRSSCWARSSPGSGRMHAARGVRPGPSAASYSGRRASPIERPCTASHNEVIGNRTR